MLARLVKSAWISSRRTLLVAVGMPALLVPVLAGCGGGGGDASSTVVDVNAGQIVRPADAGLALDDPGAVQAFETSDKFLSAWFFLGDPNRASQHVNADIRASMTALLKETEVGEGCVLRQVQGEALDANRTTVARYVIEGCEVVPPGQEPADAIDVTVTVTDQGAWVTGVQFLR